MTPTPTQALEPVEVTQADRDAATEYMRRFPDLRLPEAFARHRQSSNAASVGVDATRVQRYLADEAAARERLATFPDAVRQRLINWQEGQSEWFSSTLLEVVAEFIAFDDAALASLSTPTAEPTLIDMANVGESLMEAIRDYSSHPFMAKWSPADCPTEIVGDLLNALDEARASGSLAGGLADHFPSGLRSKRGQLPPTGEVIEGPIQCDCHCGASFAGSDEHEVRQQWATHAALSDLHPLGQEYDGDALREARAPVSEKATPPAHQHPQAAARSSGQNP